MYVLVVYLFMHSYVGMSLCVCVCVCVCVCACAYVSCACPIIFESHLRETSVARHLQRMRVADMREKISDGIHILTHIQHTDAYIHGQFILMQTQMYTLRPVCH